MKYLIVNADDYGYSKPRDDGIIHCYKKAGISSASLMVNGVSAESGVALAKQHGLPIGLHVNISEGSPIGQSGYKTLINDEGFFLGMFEFQNALREGKIDLKEVETEIRCQIDRYKKLVGTVPIHVDGHQHCHIKPGILEIFAGVLKENGVKATRVPYEVLDKDRQWSSPEFAKGFEELIEHARNARPVFAAAGIWTTDKFLGLQTMGEEILGPGNAMLYETLAHQLTREFASTADEDIVTLELMTHPGYQTKDVGGCGNGPDDFSESLDREREINVLLDRRLSEFYQSSKIQLVSFEDCVNKIKK